MPSELLKWYGVRDTLAENQPTISRKFSTDGPHIKFSLTQGMYENWKSKGPTDLVDVTVTVGNAEFNITKEAYLRALALIGLRESYIVKTPVAMTQEALNYHLSHDGAAYDSLRLQARGDVISTFLPGDSLAVPSVSFFDKVIENLDQYTSGHMVDPKICNTMNRMAVRIISTGEELDIAGEKWYKGIQIVNSSTSSPHSRTAMTGLLYNLECKSISLSSHARSGVYDRRSYSNDEDEFSDWIASHVPNILTTLDHEVKPVEMLKDLDLTGQLGDTMTDLFRTLKVPARVRPTIYNNVINQDDKSGYMLMQAIAQSADMPGLDDEMATRTMAVAGALPHLLSDRCETCHKVNV